MSNEMNDYEVYDCIYDDYENYYYHNHENDYESHTQNTNKNFDTLKINENFIINNNNKNLPNLKVNLSEEKNRQTKECLKNENIAYNINKNILKNKQFSTKNKVSKEISKNKSNKKSYSNANIDSLNDDNNLPKQNLETMDKPDFMNWPEDKLKQEMKNYGIRPTSVKQMIKQLNEIWDFLNLSIDFILTLFFKIKKKYCL